MAEDCYQPADHLSSLLDKVLTNSIYRDNARKLQKAIAESNGLSLAADLVEESLGGGRRTGKAPGSYAKEDLSLTRILPSIDPAIARLVSLLGDHTNMNGGGIYVSIFFC